MEIRWPSVFVFALAVFALVVALKRHREIAAFLAGMERIGPGHDTNEQILGLIAFGILVVMILALAVILKDDRRGR